MPPVPCLCQSQAAARYAKAWTNHDRPVPIPSASDQCGGLLPQIRSDTRMPLHCGIVPQAFGGGECGGVNPRAGRAVMTYLALIPGLARRAAFHPPPACENPTTGPVERGPALCWTLATRAALASPEEAPM